MNIPVLLDKLRQQPWIMPVEKQVLDHLHKAAIEECYWEALSRLNAQMLDASAIITNIVIKARAAGLAETLKE